MYNLKNLKAGDKIICLNDFREWVTKGRVYEVYQVYDYYIKIIDNEDELFPLDECDFIKASPRNTFIKK